MGEEITVVKINSWLKFNKKQSFIIFSIQLIRPRLFGDEQSLKNCQKLCCINLFRAVWFAGVKSELEFLL